MFWNLVDTYSGMQEKHKQNFHICHGNQIWNEEISIQTKKVLLYWNAFVQEQN